jgi:hypothetical protein
LRVVDKDTALELAKLNKWDNTIKVTESFLISEMTPEQKLKAESYPAFIVEPDKETCSLTTGVK